MTKSNKTETSVEAALDDPVLGEDLQVHIGRKLRAVYDEVANEAVPERFLRLLDELERKQGGRS